MSEQQGSFFRSMNAMSNTPSSGYVDFDGNKPIGLGEALSTGPSSGYKSSGFSGGNDFTPHESRVLQIARNEAEPYRKANLPQLEQHFGFVKGVDNQFSDSEVLKEMHRYEKYKNDPEGFQRTRTPQSDRVAAYYSALVDQHPQAAKVFPDELRNRYKGEVNRGLTKSEFYKGLSKEDKARLPDYVLSDSSPVDKRTTDRWHGSILEQNPQYAVFDKRWHPPKKLGAAEVRDYKDKIQQLDEVYGNLSPQSMNAKAKLDEWIKGGFVSDSDISNMFDNINKAEYGVTGKIKTGGYDYIYRQQHKDDKMISYRNDQIREAMGLPTMKNRQEYFNAEKTYPGYSGADLMKQRPMGPIDQGIINRGLSSVQQYNDDLNKNRPEGSPFQQGIQTFPVGY